MGHLLLVDRPCRVLHFLQEVQRVLSGQVGHRLQQHQGVQGVPLDRHLQLGQHLQVEVVRIRQGYQVHQVVHRLRLGQRVQRVQGVLGVLVGHQLQGGQVIQVGQCLQVILGVLVVQRVQLGIVSRVVEESFRMGQLGLCQGLRELQVHQVGQAFRCGQECQLGQGVQASSIQSIHQLRLHRC